MTIFNAKRFRTIEPVSYTHLPLSTSLWAGLNQVLCMWTRGQFPDCLLYTSKYPIFYFLKLSFGKQTQIFKKFWGSALSILKTSIRSHPYLLMLSFLSYFQSYKKYLIFHQIQHPKIYVEGEIFL